MMDDRELFEKIKMDMEDIEIPDSISPLRMREKLKKVRPDRKVVKFTRKGINMASRIAAACALVVVAGGVGTVAFMGQSGEPSVANSTTAIMADSMAESPAVADSMMETAVATDSDVEPTVLGLDELGRHTRATSYQEIFDKFYSPMASSFNGGFGMSVTTDAMDDVAEEEFSDSDMAVSNKGDGFAGGLGASGNLADEGYYTDTLLQVEGVYEADVIKTDGKSIFVLKADLGKIFILDAKTLEEKTVLSVELPDELKEKHTSRRIQEMYLAGDKLHVIYVDSTPIERELKEIEDPIIVYDEDVEEDVSDDVSESEDLDIAYDEVWMPWYYGADEETHVVVFDVSNPASVSECGSLTQDGNYITSRMIGNKFYLMTSEYSYNYRIFDKDIDYCAEENLSKWVPEVNGCLVAPEDIYYVDNSTSWQCVGSFDLDNYESIDSKVLYDSYGQFYMTTDNLYIYQNDWSYEDKPDGGYISDSLTNISRFDIRDGYITAAAAGSFEGTIGDTFAIHESGDYLYLVMDIDYWDVDSDWRENETKRWTNLYVVDKDMNEVGRLEGIAPEERVYSARFIGDIGYFVTYRNMDPLFSVDLSDPTNPTLLGELEIPGFSDYLQAWGDHQLIGIGEERDADSNLIGLKVSLFDISDPTNVIEIDKAVIKADESSALYNYKDLLADYRTGLIGFVATDYNWNDPDFDWENDEDYYHTDAYIFKVDGDKISQEAQIKFNEGTYWSYERSRVMYIDGDIILSDDESIRSFNIADGYTKNAEYTYPKLEEDVDDGFYYAIPKYGYID